MFGILKIGPWLWILPLLHLQFGMYLKEMKRHFNFFLILLFPICVSGQIKTFQSPILQSFFSSDTTKRLSISPRLFGISSLGDSGSENTYIAGTTLLANISTKVTFISHFDYLGGNHNILINEYQD